jgi:hypothetical protein
MVRVRAASSATAVVLAAFLSASGRASAQANPHAVSFWDHNGSVVSLSADGAMRQFFYEQPRPAIQAQGVTPGRLLFTGRKEGDGYSGTAYIFSSTCGATPYEVSGAVSSDSRQVTMHGMAPRVDSNCHIVSYRDDTLVFTFQRTVSNLPEAAPTPAAAPVPSSICTNVDAIRQIIKLQDLEGTDQMSGRYPSVATPQRKAIMQELATKYCRPWNQPIVSDYQEKIQNSLCTVYSGVQDGSRVYWAHCLDCGTEVQCE